jgi:hypothetical protein
MLRYPKGIVIEVQEKLLGPRRQEAEAGAAGMVVYRAGWEKS